MRHFIKHCFPVCLLGLLPALPAHSEPAQQVPDLGKRISEFQAQQPAPPAHLSATMEQAAKALAEAMPEPGLEIGSRAPDFQLPDAFGHSTRLSDLLANGPVILTFYRGAWCPYCNLQLKALKESLPHFERHHAQLVAVTPQTPDRSAGQIEKDGYPFPILSDLDDRVMKSYNLYFEVPEELRTLYVENFSLDIAAYNGEGRYGLPVPGTFIIDRQGVIRASFADTDYTKRMEPAAIVEALESLDKNPLGRQ